MISPRALLPCLLLAVAPGCHRRPASAVDWEHRAVYEPGTALRHVPQDCAGGHLYVDLPAARRNEALGTAIELASDRFLAGAAKSSRDKRALAALGEAFRDEGFVFGRDVKELGACWGAGNTGVTFTLGGDFSGKDLFRAVRRASERLGEEPPEVAVMSGVPYVRIGGLALARPAPNVLALGEDVGLLASLGKPNDRAAEWGVTNGRALVGRLGAEDDVWLACTDRGPELELQLMTHTKRAAAELEVRRPGVSERLAQTPLKMLSAAVLGTEIVTKAGTATFTLRPRSSDAAAALRVAVDLPPGGLRKIFGYVFGGGGDGGGGEKI